MPEAIPLLLNPTPLDTLLRLPPAPLGLNFPRFFPFAPRPPFFLLRNISARVSGSAQGLFLTNALTGTSMSPYEKWRVGGERAEAGDRVVTGSK